MKKIGKTMIALALAGAMFASQTTLASAKEVTFAASKGKYTAKVYTVGGKYDTVNGIARVSDLIFYTKGSWTASAANDGKKASYSFGKDGKKANVRSKRVFLDNKNKSLEQNFVKSAHISFYW